jgi:acyl carrier protein
MNEKLKEIVTRVLGEDFAAIEAVEDFRDSEFWDSLKYVNLVVSLQNEFKIELKKKDIQQVFSVASIRSVLSGYGIKP